MIIRGYDIDLTDALAFVALPGGGIFGLTRPQLDEWAAHAIPSDPLPEDEYNGRVVPAAFELDDAAPDPLEPGLPQLAPDLENDVVTLGQILELAAREAHGIAGEPLADSAARTGTGFADAIYFGPARAPRDRYFHETVEAAFATDTGTPAAILLHAPALAAVLNTDARYDINAAGDTAAIAIADVCDWLEATSLGRSIVALFDAGAFQPPATLNPDGTWIEGIMRPWRGIHQAVAAAASDGRI